MAGCILNSSIKTIETAELLQRNPANTGLTSFIAEVFQHLFGYTTYELTQVPMPVG